MKANLVVASGVHQGKVIKITGSEFVIGRDPQCNLRPASQAVSKKHCAIVLRDGTAFLRDFGSTNGTSINDDLLKDAERELVSGDRVRVGPLDFTVQLDPTAASTGEHTPMPAVVPPEVAAAAAVKPAAPPAKNQTPGPRPAVAPTPKLSAPKKGGDASNDDIAAMLLGMEDDESVPGGSTVTDLPAVLKAAEEAATAAAKPDDKAKKPGAPSPADTSKAANDLLRKYRTRTT